MKSMLSSMAAVTISENGSAHHDVHAQKPFVRLRALRISFLRALTLASTVGGKSGSPCDHRGGNDAMPPSLATAEAKPDRRCRPHSALDNRDFGDQVADL